MPAARFPTPRSRNEASAFCSLSGSIARRCGQFSPAPPSAAPAPLPTSGFAKFLRKYTSRMWFVRGEFAKSEFFPFWAKFAMSSNQKKKGSWEKKTRQGREGSSSCAGAWRATGEADGDEPRATMGLNKADEQKAVAAAKNEISAFSDMYNRCCPAAAGVRVRCAGRVEDARGACSDAGPALPRTAPPRPRVPALTAARRRQDAQAVL